MKINDSIIDEISGIVEEIVPPGKDLLLHVDRRKMTLKVILNILEEKNISYNISTIKYLARNWNFLLHSRSQILN